MKFIDLYDKNKDCSAFVNRKRKFETWKYLSKKNPKKYKLELVEQASIFIFYERMGVASEWVKVDDTSGKYSKMRDFETGY